MTDKKDASSPLALLIIVALLAVGVWWLLSPSKGDASRGTAQTTEAEQRVAAMEQSMDAGALPIYLNRSDVEDIVAYMGRSVDSMRRGNRDRRHYVWRFSDGSELVFVMVPNPDGEDSGLVLNHFRAE